MNKKMSRRDFLKLAGATSASLALSACGVKATALPTATSIQATGTSLPTETLTPTLTSTPTLPLEQLPQTKEALAEFVQAFQSAGMDISTDQLIQRGFEIHAITGKDEKQYGIALVHTESPDRLGSNYPLMIRKEGGEWEVSSTRNTPEQLFGTKIAFQADIAELSRLPEYKHSYLYVLNKYAGAIFDNLSYTPENIEKYGLSAAQVMIDEANKNNSTLMIYQGFWHMDYPDALRNANETIVASYMQEYAETIIKATKQTTQPSVVSIFNEPLAYYAGQNPGWNESPYEKTYGKNVLAEAYLQYYKAAEKEGLVIGKDVFFVINEAAIYMNNKKTDMFVDELKYTKELIAQKLQSEGKTITVDKVSLGVSMEVRIDVQNTHEDIYDSHGRLRAPKEGEIYDSIQKLKIAGASSVSLSEIGVVAKIPDERNKTIQLITNEALKAGASIIQFEGVLNFSQPDTRVDIRPDVTGFFEQDTTNKKYIPTLAYYELMRTMLAS